MPEFHDERMGTAKKKKRMKCGHLVTPQEKTMVELLEVYWGRKPIEMERPPDTFPYD